MSPEPARRPPTQRTHPREAVGVRGAQQLTRRIRAIQVLVVLGALGLIVQLVNLQVVRAAHFSKLSTAQLLTTLTVPAVRGGIYDRYGQPLAMSIPTKEVVADDFQITHPASEAAALAPLVGVAASTLVPKLEEQNGYVVLATNVGVAQATTIANDVFPGITLLDSAQRVYPDGSLAASVIGSTYADGAGSAGLEYQYQQLLAGQSGEERTYQSPNGVSLPSSQVQVLRKPVAGTGIETTIDAPLQFVTEQALGQELVSSDGLSGTAIVLDTRTGQILSMANMVNENQHDAAIQSPAIYKAKTGIPGVFEAQNNLAVTQTYEPGSVFKIVPFSASLLAGIITPASHFLVPDQVLLDGYVFHDAESHGLLDYTATQILEYSSNIGTYEITSRLGEAGLLAGVDRLGFGQPSGLEFPGESDGLIVNASEFSPTDMASMPIGQVDAVTPLQVIDAYNIVANGGVYVPPTLVRATVGVGGTVHAVAPEPQHRALPVWVANDLRRMLIQVVAGGTGTEAAVPGYTIAGKTGTAQIPYAGRAAYIEGAYNATFVGFAPAQHPELTMIVVIQRPTPVIYGGSIAAPVFARVMSYALHRYGVPTSSVSYDSNPQGGSASLIQDVT